MAAARNCLTKRRPNVFRWRIPLLLGAILESGSAFAAPPSAAPFREIPSTFTLKATDLARELGQPVSFRPLVLHIGFRVLFRAGHIPDSQFGGPGSSPEGLAKLRETLGRVDRNRPIVLYCGCCPWKDCPNVRPAFAEARRMKFKSVRTLYLPQDYNADWVDKGFPTRKSK